MSHHYHRYPPERVRPFEGRHDLPLGLVIKVAGGLVGHEVILRREKSVSGNLHAMRDAAGRSMRKNRALLPAHLRGQFWRDCLASVYTDYAKRAYRAGRLRLAYADTLHALMLSPLGRGRLCLGLLRDFVLRKPL